MNGFYEEDIEKLCLHSSLSMYLKNKTVLIIGTYGMIGRVVADSILFCNQHYNTCCRIVALGRNLQKAELYFKEAILAGKMEFLCGDINEAEIPSSYEFDYVIYAAGNTHPLEYAGDPVGTIETNIIGLNNILKYQTSKLKGRLLYISTVEIYGENRGDTELFDENYSGYINCNTLRAGYSESKRTGEALCQAYILKYGLDIAIVRLARTFGSTMDMDDSKALSQFINSGLYKDEIILKSEGTQLFSYIYVMDAVGGIYSVLFRGQKGEAYNLANDNTYLSLRDIAYYIGKIAEKPVITELPDCFESQGYSKSSKALMDNNKIKQLGWKQQYTFEEGLLRTFKILKGE